MRLRDGEQRWGGGCSMAQTEMSVGFICWSYPRNKKSEDNTKNVKKNSLLLRDRISSVEGQVRWTVCFYRTLSNCKVAEDVKCLAYADLWWVTFSFGQKCIHLKMCFSLFMSYLQKIPLSKETTPVPTPVSLRPQLFQYSHICYLGTNRF